MGLILCEHNEILHPFYISELRLNIYSYEELCYVIFKNPILVREHFINNELLDFLELELGMSPLKSRLAKMNSDKTCEDDKLLYILSYGDVYAHNEIMQYKKLLDRLSKIHKAEYLMLRARYMFELELYGRAASDYNKILKFNRDKYVTTKFIASVYENLGSAYANLFMYDRALECYKAAFEVLQDKSILQKMYLISQVDGGIELSANYADQIKDQDKNEWDDLFVDTLGIAGESHRMHRLETIFAQSSSSMQKKMIHEILGEWKLQYRSMM